VPFALLVVGLVVGGMCALLALNTASAANELARHNLAAKDSDVAARLVQASNQVAASAAPGALASAAAELGMVPASAPAFLKIGADGRVTLLGSPAAAVAPPAPPPPSPPPPKPRPTKAKATKTKAAKTTAHAPVKKKVHSATPTPTPTPTPTTTLPGGTR
jgi:outer membrane biosynthesis protein TonB